MTAVLTVGGEDVSSLTYYDVTVTAGRDDIDTQPDATVLTTRINGWHPAGQVGDQVILHDDLGQLFAGTITDLDTHLEQKHDPSTGTLTWAWMTTLTAAGPLAQLGRTVIGDEPWPEESDSQRIARILTLAGAPSSVDPGILGPAILARDVDRRDAAELARDVADDARGVLWEQPADPNYPIRYQPGRLRTWEPVPLAWAELGDRTWDQLDELTWDQLDSAAIALPGDPGHLTIDAGQVAVGITLTQQISDLALTVRIAWGPTPEGGSQEEVIVGTGIPEIARSTQLANSGAALAVADAMWRTRREPAWRIREVEIDLATIPPADAATIRAGLAAGARLTITRIAFDAPPGPTWQGYVEGWQHDLQPGHHYLRLRTSERALTEPGNQWQDLDDAMTWNDADMTWAEM